MNHFTINNLVLKEELTTIENTFNNYANNLLKNEKYVCNGTSFREENWLITFPFNYSLFSNSFEIELIRKLAVINSLYLVFFFWEDDVFDEYHLQTKEYKNYLLKMCMGHQFKNLALGQLIHLCGNEVYKYFNNYEQIYYDTIYWEKTINTITLENMLTEENLSFLGKKLLPLGITFSGFCLMNNTPEKIETCEKLLINYHIAKQLSDDIIDLRDDLLKPDYSYVIKSCMNSSGKNHLSYADIKKVINDRDYKSAIYDSIQNHLTTAQYLCNELDFHIFNKHIELAKRKISKAELFT